MIAPAVAIGAPNGAALDVLVLSGGPHPFAETTPILRSLLEDAGCAVEVVEHPSDAAVVLRERPPALWVCNTLRWRMLARRYADRRDEFGYETPGEVRRAFDHYVRNGGHLLALHAAPICFDDWPGWASIVGARWDWEVSSHPPLGEMEVRVIGDHPITRGVDRFEILDEAYGRMRLAADLEPLAVSRWDAEDHPVLWVREVGEGLVVTSTLGHSRESFENPAHRRILHQAVTYIAGKRPSPDRSNHG